MKITQLLFSLLWGVLQTTTSLAFQQVAPWGQHQTKKNQYHSFQLHDSTLQEIPVQSPSFRQDDDDWKDLCEAVCVEPAGLLRLQESSTGVRGVYLNCPVQANEIVLSIPVTKCLCDDTPPTWMPVLTEEDDASCGWAARLAACLLEEQLFKQEQQESHTKLWLSLLPNPEFLRASLPIHWEEDLLQSTRCTALEVAVDTAFFGRAGAVQDLVAVVREKQKTDNTDTVQRWVENALDVVQTRTCRVSGNRRLLAPVFDCLNHDGSNANAGFELQGDRLVVSALVDLQEGQEVLIDYGESARPAWKCLTSYGFVPSFPFPGDEEDEYALAEVYMNGIRYEVGPSFIPVEMVAAALDSSIVEDANMVGYPPEDESVELTPDIAIRLERRLSQVAFQLLVDPPTGTSTSSSNDDDDLSDEEDVEDEDETAERILSSQLAASLRWNQHRILSKCALGLREWAAQQSFSGE
jgi:hypothetical protein